MLHTINTANCTYHIICL